MNKDYYRKKIGEFLYSRNVKKPSIRLNALERVFNYMELAGGYIEGGRIYLREDRSETIEKLAKIKENDLSGSEKHVLKLMYDYYKVP